MLLREIIDCESTYNKTPEGKANVKTADNALDATSGKFMFSKNLVNSNFDEDIDEEKKEPEVFNKKDQIIIKKIKTQLMKIKMMTLIMKMRMMSFYHLHL